MDIAFLGVFTNEQKPHVGMRRGEPALVPMDECCDMARIEPFQRWLDPGSPPRC